MKSANISVRGIPQEIYEAIKQRARRNNRSLEGEIRAILEAVTEVEREDAEKEARKATSRLGRAWSYAANKGKAAARSGTLSLW